MRPSSLLTLLCGCALIFGARLHSERTQQHPELSENSGAQDRIKELERELDQLKTDNANLRALLENPTTISISPELVKFVEKDLGLTFSVPPQVSLGSEEALREAASRLWLTAFTEQGIAIRNYAFESLGILPTNQNLIGQLISAETIGAVGVFDQSSKEIVLAEQYDSENIHHQAGLVRLLAIALLEQTYPLPKALTDDALYSHLALHRGRAAMLQERFYSLQARHIGFVDETENTEARELFHSLSTYARDITIFPNTFGKDYVAKLPTAQEVTSALSSKTASTRNILLSQPFSSNSKPTELSPHFDLNTTLGAITVRSFLNRITLPSEQLTLAISGFHSDTLTVSSSPEKNTLTQWKTHWKDSSSAQIFHQHCQQLIGSLESPPSLSLTENIVILTVTISPQSE